MRCSAIVGVPVDARGFVDRLITEVADKFHLVKNITDRMTKLVAENYADYRQAVRSNEEGQVKTTETNKRPVSHKASFSKARLKVCRVQ